MNDVTRPLALFALFLVGGALTIGGVYALYDRTKPWAQPRSERCHLAPKSHWWTYDGKPNALPVYYCER